jgi:hypothetical protein
MSVAHSPSPGSPAADPLGARRLALLDRQLERLDQLIGAGMDMVQGLAAQASGAGPRVVQGDVILAYSRAARAVRMAMLLQSHLVAEFGAARDARAGDAAGTVGAQARADRVVEALADRERDRPEPAERREAERAERLERDDIYRAVQTRPARELVAEIANDLGLSPDWPETMDAPEAPDDVDGDARRPPFAPRRSQPPPPSASP